MSVNKNFPNYKKEKLTVRVLSRHSTGPNHSQRRHLDAQAKHAKSFRRKMDASMLQEEARKARAERTQRRIHRARTRRIEREVAKKKGIPVKYSIK